MAVILPELLARTMPASSPLEYECMDGGAGSGTGPPPVKPASHTTVITKQFTTFTQHPH